MKIIFFHRISPHFLQKFTAFAFQRLLNLAYIHKKYQTSKWQLAQWNKQVTECRRAEVWTQVRTILFFKNTGNAVKINNSPRLTAFTAKDVRNTRWKLFFSTAFHRISYKNSPHLLSNVYSVWLTFTRNIKQVSDSWRSGISRWQNAGEQRFEPA